MLLLTLLAAAPITFVVDNPVEVDGQWVVGRTTLPRKASYRVRSGREVVALERLERVTQVVVRSMREPLEVELIEAAPKTVGLYRSVDELGARYVLVDREQRDLTLAEPALRFDGWPVSACPAILAKSTAVFPTFDEACFVEAKAGGRFRAEARVLAEPGPIRRVWVISTEFTLAPDPRPRRLPIVLRELRHTMTCRCDGTPFWSPANYAPGDYPANSNFMPEK